MELFFLVFSVNSLAARHAVVSQRHRVFAECLTVVKHAGWV